MTNNLFAQFDKQFDLAGLQADIKDAAENKSSGDKVPHGDYEVKVHKLELKASKNNKPMVSAWFKIVDGSQKGQIIFMNQVIEQGFQIHIMNEFLRSLKTGVDVEFKTYSQYAGVLADIFEATKNFEYGLEYTENNKGYDQYKITDVFEV